MSFFTRAGLDIDMTDAQTLSNSVQALRAEKDSDDKVQVVLHKCLQKLNQARYECIDDKEPSDYSHFGLNFAIYTHFTSPIRRYADVVVHRLLTVALEEKENTRNRLDGMLNLLEYNREISDRVYNARKASRDCVTLFHCLLLKEQGAKVFEALVYDISKNTIRIYVEEHGLRLVVDLASDRRIDSTTLLDDELLVACSFKKPLCLASWVSIYTGQRQLSRSRQQKKKEEELQRMIADKKELMKRLKAQNDADQDELHEMLERFNEESEYHQSVLDNAGLPPNQSNNCSLAVFDRVKVKVEATDTFPLDFKATLMLTADDEAEFG